MGLAESKPYKNSKFLHYAVPNDNRINVFFPEKKLFKTFLIKKRDQDFSMEKYETLGVSTGAIYILGGLLEKSDLNVLEDETPDGLTSPGRKSNVQFKKSKTCADGIPTNFVCKINLNKHNDKGIIDISERKGCKIMPEERWYHLSLYCNQWIYVIGGYIGGKQTNTCRRFNIKQKSWSPMQSIEFDEDGVVEACGISYGSNFLYIFDTAVNATAPIIYKYIIESDKWAKISSRNNQPITPSIRGNVYQITDTDLLIVGGYSPQIPGNKGSYYTFSITNEKYSTRIESTSALPLPVKDRQGDLNYSTEDLVYCGLENSKVRVFDKKTFDWSMEQLERNISSSGGGSGGLSFACCSRSR
jgi:hypothetical protein